MQKIAASDAKIFKIADSIYDTAAAALRNVSSHPKTFFRAAFVITCASSAFALLSAGVDVVDSEVKRYQFNESHAELIQAIQSNNLQKYTVEQRAIAFKMFSCVSAGMRYRGEAFCATQLVADAAINGGVQRAEAMKANLRELGFSAAHLL